MEQLEKSIKYVPPYELVERIKAEEKRIRSEAIKIASLKNMEKGIKLGTKEGLRQGEEKLKQEKYETARIVKSLGDSNEKIQKVTGLSEAVIRTL